MLCNGTPIGAISVARPKAGRIDEAATHASEALVLARRLGAQGSEAHALGLVADVALAQGRDNAEAQYRLALTLASELSLRPDVAHRHLGLGRLLQRLGRHEQATEHLTAAGIMYREMAMPFWLEQVEDITRP